MKVLVTGASGFIGSHVIRGLFEEVLEVKAALRNPNLALPSTIPTEIIGSINKQTNWDKALDGADTVIHLAAHAHATNPKDEKPFYEVNFDGTKHLAERARAHGVKKFIFLSSVSAVRRVSEEPIHEEMKPEPETPYAKSKYFAEEAIKDTFNKSDTKFTIIRAPAVFGLGCRGNLKTLFSLVQRQFPIPLGASPTIRSIISVDGLSSLLTHCLQNEASNNQIFHAADPDQIPLRDLIKLIGEELGVNSPTLEIPKFAWKTAEYFTSAFDSIGLSLPVTTTQLSVLHEPLLVSAKKLQSMLNWKQKLTLHDALSQWVRKERNQAAINS